MNFRMNGAMGCLTVFIVFYIIMLVLRMSVSILFSWPVMLVIGVYLVYRGVKYYINQRKPVEPPHYHFESDQEKVVDVDFEEYE